MLKVAMCEGGTVLEISCDCADGGGSPPSTNIISFTLKPNPSSQPAAAKKLLGNSDSKPAVDTPSVELVITMWKLDGYLIIQTNKISYSVYAPDGCFVGDAGNAEGIANVISAHKLSSDSQPGSQL